MITVIMSSVEMMGTWVVAAPNWRQRSCI
jgi:hypothetical protein